MSCPIRVSHVERFAPKQTEPFISTCWQHVVVVSGVSIPRQRGLDTLTILGGSEIERAAALSVPVAICGKHRNERNSIGAKCICTQLTNVIYTEHAFLVMEVTQQGILKNSIQLPLFLQSHRFFVHSHPKLGLGTTNSLSANVI